MNGDDLATIVRRLYNWNTVDYIRRHGFLDRQDAHRFTSNDSLSSAPPRGDYSDRAFALNDAQTIQCRVVGISDGDTITVLDISRAQHKIRLAGIDAPEKRQPFGNVSKQNLARMVFNKEVTVDYDKRDPHCRIVGKVLVEWNDICIPPD